VFIKIDIRANFGAGNKEATSNRQALGKVPVELKLSCWWL
jgi:hypothetical protein